MFLGESTHSLDAKGRVFVPKRVQAELSQDDEGHRVAVLARGLNGCLNLFTEAGFEREVARLRSSPFSGPQARRAELLFYSTAFPAQVDKSGRLVIPEKLRKLAKLTEDVTLIGLGERVEIWDRATWEAFEAAHAGEFDELAPAWAAGQAGAAPEPEGA